MIRSVLIAILAAAALALPAFAQPAPPPAADATKLTLSERAEKTLPRDRLHADLRVEAIDADPVHIQAEINRRMNAALGRAKQAPGVAVETAGYNVYQERDAKEKTVRWHGSQGLRLTASDFGALLELAAALQQQGLTMTNLSADLSPAAAKAAQDELTDAALTQIRARAARIATTLGTQVDRYAELHVGNVTTPPVILRVMAAVAAPAAMPPPVAEAGDATIGITVDATVMLAPVPR